MDAPIIKIAALDDNLDLVEDSHQIKFIQRDGLLVCADPLAVDYYGEYRGGYPWVHPKLEEWAKEQGGYWEWENPECVCFAD